MNVSFTRARSKLIIIGSRGTLRGADILAGFFELVEGRGWIMRLPEGAHLLHPSTSLLFGAKATTSPGKTTPVKRMLKEGCEDGGKEGVEGENIVGGKRLVKKVKVDVAGLVRGRPILKDLVNGDMDVV